jgi:hypothetical protein
MGEGNANEELIVRVLSQVVGSSGYVVISKDDICA